MKSDPNKWYVYTRGWEDPCYELYIQDDDDGAFLDDQACPKKVFRWCYVDYIARALNDVTRAFMQSEAVKLDKQVD